MCAACWEPLLIAACGEQASAEGGCRAERRDEAGGGRGGGQAASAGQGEPSSEELLLQLLELLSEAWPDKVPAARTGQHGCPLRTTTAHYRCAAPIPYTACRFGVHFGN